MSQREEPDVNLWVTRLDGELRKEGDLHPAIEQICAQLDRRTRYAVFLLLSKRVFGNPVLLEKLVVHTQNMCPGLGADIALQHYEDGKISEGLPYLRMSLVATKIEDSLSQIAKSIRAALLMGVYSEADVLLDELFNRIDDLSARAEIMSLAYDAARSGRREYAEAILKRAFRCRPADADLQARYRKFRKTMEQEKKHPVKHSVVSIGNLPKEKLPLNPNLDRAKQALEAGAYDELVGLCGQTFKGRFGHPECSAWLNYIQTLVGKHRQLGIAIALWAIIIEHAPYQAGAFIAFVKRHGLEDEPQVDEMLKIASAISGNRRRIGKKAEAALMNGKRTDTQVLSEIVVIDGAAREMSHWLPQAGHALTMGRPGDAIALWARLLEKDPRVLPSVVRGLVRMARELSPEDCLREMRFSQTLSVEPRFAEAYRLTAEHVRRHNAGFAREILRAIDAPVPFRHPKADEADTIIARGEWQRMPQLWLPLELFSARDCAACAVKLVGCNQPLLASRLFAAIAEMVPSVLVDFAYKALEGASVGPAMSAALETLLPSGSEQKLQRHHYPALKLYVQRSPEYHRVSPLIESLLGTGALTQMQYSELTQKNYAHIQRDEEIEAYLRQFTPTLRTGKFFTAAQERGLPLKPGKKTSRNARNVINRPNFIGETQPYPAPPRRKKRP
jgi:tetratricopeptide (TPR) repeat protein